MLKRASSRHTSIFEASWKNPTNYSNAAGFWYAEWVSWGRLNVYQSLVGQPTGLQFQGYSGYREVHHFTIPDTVIASCTPRWDGRNYSDTKRYLIVTRKSRILVAPRYIRFSTVIYSPNLELEGPFGHQIWARRGHLNETPFWLIEGILGSDHFLIFHVLGNDPQSTLQYPIQPPIVSSINQTEALTWIASRNEPQYTTQSSQVQFKHWSLTLQK